MLKMHFKYCVVLVFLFVCHIRAFDYPQIECSSHCTLAHKESIGCWNQTLSFFEEVLLDQIRGYIVAQSGFAVWKSKNDRKMDWKEAAKSTVDKMAHINPPDIEDENGITDHKIYVSVVQSLIDNAKDVFDTRPDADFKLPCPLGCEIEHETYKRMFLGSIIGSGVLFVLILVLSMYNYRRVKNSVNREAVEALQAYELNLTNKSKQTFKLIDVDI